MSYDGIAKRPSGEISGRRESTENRLERRKKHLEEELKAVNDALQLFKEHPELSQAYDLLGQIGF